MHADPEFLAFVESLSAQPEALPSGDAAGSSGQKAGQDSGTQITALMAYLQEKHSLKKKPPAIMVRAKALILSYMKRSLGSHNFHASHTHIP